MKYTSPFDTIPGSATSWPSPAATDEPDLSLPCQDPDNLDLWFAERGDDVERAKAMCGDCPLKATCLEGAVERAEPWGVWGGEVFIDGRVVPRKRGRGRPRKDEAARWNAA
ncbi:WhiB family transcriptional regulator [Pseudactinotalea sp.]|uniref:WhiB family transcriptional regulator n=1 Tax=Pseudactinotalea sp. TaxID=1926260 RepID=UPI003B3AF59F